MFTPVKSSIKGIEVPPNTIQQVAFTKKEGRWYLAAAGYVLQKGQRACTEIAAYTDELLAWMGRRRHHFTLMLNTKPFEGARVLELEELCTNGKGGAYYRMASKQGSHSIRLWVCDTSLLVFGDLPPRIFFRRSTNQ